jgi:hypothetical protein
LIFNRLPFPFSINAELSTDISKFIVILRTFNVPVMDCHERQFNFYWGIFALLGMILANEDCF